MRGCAFSIIRHDSLQYRFSDATRVETAEKGAALFSISFQGLNAIMDHNQSLMN